MSITASNLENLQVNPDWKSLPLFDRSEWTRVRFGDVVQNINETADPLAEGIERFIGMEHLEPGSLHVRSWGNVADGTTFSRRCRPGQVLFGKRRAYQRKVAVAEFDAVVSSDIYLFAPKDERLLPELLPFICMSERFFGFAVETSAGSLSPRTNWKHLELFEFELPTVEQQRRIAEVLWAVDTVQTTVEHTLSSVASLINSELHDFLYGEAQWPRSACRDLLSEGPRNGFSPPPTNDSTEIPTLSLSAIRDGKVLTQGSIKYAAVDPDLVAQYQLRKDDILIVRGNGNRMLCGKAGIVGEYPKGCFYPDLLIRLRFRSDFLLPDFAVLQWNESVAHSRLLKKAKSSNGIYKINGQDIQSHVMAVPPIASQHLLLDSLGKKTACVEALTISDTHAVNLRTELINTLFDNACSPKPTPSNN